MDYLNSLKVKGDVVAYFTDYPLLFSSLWTINVFSLPIAAVLLVFRRKWAVWGALAATISKLSLDVLTFTFWDRFRLFGPWLSLVDITILLLTCGFYFYCKAMARKGILK